MNLAESSGFFGLGALCLALLGLAPAAAQSPVPSEGEPWEKRSGQWFESIEPGGTLRVVNRYGNIYARFGGYENRVEILSTNQRIERDRPELEVRLNSVDGGLEVVVVELRDEAAGGAFAGPGDRKDRVDLVAFVPIGVTLEAETHEDQIEGKGLKSDVQARSFKGDIRLRQIVGRVNAETARGKIAVTLETGVTQQPQEFVTETGDIELYLWEDADMQVDVATSGEISTDFSMQIEHSRFEEPGKRGVAVVGQGGPKLSLRSKRGHVRLLRLQKDFKPND